MQCCDGLWQTSVSTIITTTIVIIIVIIVIVIVGTFLIISVAIDARWYRNGSGRRVGK